ncbi:MAG: hypothetical protein VKP62_03825 [Candidatus Sericytochromatia bacterium]|nr:hypothetical protein [Candidatus Sericytochromatia bacterium]
MFAFDRHITLEDHLGQRHALALIDRIDGHYFVLLPCEAIREVVSHCADVEAVLETLDAALLIMDVRRHRFLPGLEAAEVLSRSGHPVLRALAPRWLVESQPAADDESSDEWSAEAFASECRRRATH